MSVEKFTNVLESPATRKTAPNWVEHFGYLDPEHEGVLFSPYSAI